MNQIIETLKNYALSLPTGVVAVILIIVGLKLGKKILKLIGIALIAAAIVFYVMKV